MSVTLDRCFWHHHLPAFRLSNPAVQLVVSRQGGNIVALDSLRTGRSWMWSNPHLMRRRPIPGDSYIRDHDAGGWDELFPTVHPCSVRGTPWGDSELTDHGELWCRDWHEITDPGEDHGSAVLALAVNEPGQPFRFTRTLRLDQEAAKFTLDYRVENRSTQTLPYLWAAHPLLPLEPGCRIELPPGTSAVCSAAIGPDPPVPRQPFLWPLAATASGGMIDLSACAGGTGRAIKLFTEFLPQGWVRVVAPDSTEILEWAFDPTAVPCVGLWINDGGWSGAGTAPYHNLGVEPTTAACDRLSDAIDRQIATVLEPGASRQWAMTVSLFSEP